MERCQQEVRRASLAFAQVKERRRPGGPALGAPPPAAPRHGPSPHSPSRPRAGGPSNHSSTCHQPRSHMARGGRWPGPPPRPKGNLRTATRVALPAGGRLSEGSPGARARARAAILTTGSRRGRHLGVGRPSSALWLAPSFAVVSMFFRS